MKNIEIIYGDITSQKFDAIVNSANKSLLAGSGVCGVIHKAAGKELEKECMLLNGCPTGEAKITKSYNLQKNDINWIIHAVGPRWLGGNNNEEALLESVYRNTLELTVNYEKIYLKQYIDVVNKKYKNELKRSEIEELIEKEKEYIKEHKIKTIAFPSISTGIYKFPLEKAADIALNTIKSFLEINNSLNRVGIVCFDLKTYEGYMEKL